MAHSDPQALRVLPFRGLRFDPARVRDPAAVTSPPYDMIGPREAQRLADTEEHNVVRLILPGQDEVPDGPRNAGAPTNRYRRAAESLARWRAEGALRLDDTPGFYVYEQSGPGGRQRGLIALVHLDDEGAGRSILPHEAVVAEVVDDRLAQMRATAANIEPILLTYAGHSRVSDLVDQAADQGEPLWSSTTPDGTRHRLWTITEPSAVARIRADLVWHRALIADGHHRHAAYRKLRAESGDPAADYGLALLVDASRYPLSLHAIHRVLPNVPLDAAIAEAAKVFAVREIADPQHGLDHAGPDEHAFVLSDGARSVLLTDPDPAALRAAVPADRPEAWRRLDATVLHHVLVEAVWKLPDTPEEVRFDHDPVHAVAHAAEVGGTAVLLRPTTEATVRELAAAGVLMPRKSTAFGPKPATGLVMRLLDEGPVGAAS